MPLAITLLDRVVTVDNATFDVAALSELQNHIARLPSAASALTLQLLRCTFTEELNILQFIESAAPSTIVSILFSECALTKSITPNTLQEFINQRSRLYVRVNSGQIATSPPELVQLHHFCNWLHYKSHHSGAAHLAQQTELPATTRQILDLQYLTDSYEFRLLWDFAHRLDLDSEEYANKTRELTAAAAIIIGSDANTSEPTGQLSLHIKERLTWLAIMPSNVDYKAQREYHTHLQLIATNSNMITVLYGTATPSVDPQHLVTLGKLLIELVNNETTHIIKEKTRHQLAAAIGSCVIGLVCEKVLREFYWRSVPENTVPSIVLKMAPVAELIANSKLLRSDGTAPFRQLLISGYLFLLRYLTKRLIDDIDCTLHRKISNMRDEQRLAKLNYHETSTLVVTALVDYVQQNPHDYYAVQIMLELVSMYTAQQRHYVAVNDDTLVCSSTLIKQRQQILSVALQLYGQQAPSLHQPPLGTHQATTSIMLWVLRVQCLRLALKQYGITADKSASLANRDRRYERNRPGSINDEIAILNDTNFFTTFARLRVDRKQHLANMIRDVWQQGWLAPCRDIIVRINELFDFEKDNTDDIDHTLSGCYSTQHSLNKAVYFTAIFDTYFLMQHILHSCITYVYRQEFQGKSVSSDQAKQDATTLLQLCDIHLQIVAIISLIYREFTQFCVTNSHGFVRETSGIAEITPRVVGEIRKIQQWLQHIIDEFDKSRLRKPVVAFDNKALVAQQQQRNLRIVAKIPKNPKPLPPQEQRQHAPARVNHVNHARKAIEPPKPAEFMRFPNISPLLESGKFDRARQQIQEYITRTQANKSDVSKLILHYLSADTDHAEALHRDTAVANRIPLLQQATAHFTQALTELSDLTTDAMTRNGLERDELQTAIALSQEKLQQDIALATTALQNDMLQRAWQAYTQEQFPLAIVLFTEINSFKPQESAYGLGLIYMKCGDLSLAQHHFTSIPVRAPRYRDSRIKLCTSLLSQQDTIAAGKIIAELSQQYSDSDTQVLLARAQYEQHQGQSRQAIVLLEQAVAQAPFNVRARVFLAERYEAYGHLHLANEQLHEAASFAERTSDSYATKRAALAALRIGQDKLSDVFKNAHKKMQTAALYIAILEAELLATAGDYAAAIREYHNLFAHNPHSISLFRSYHSFIARQPQTIHYRAVMETQLKMQHAVNQQLKFYLLANKVELSVDELVTLVDFINDPHLSKIEVLRVALPHAIQAKRIDLVRSITSRFATRLMNYEDLPLLIDAYCFLGDMHEAQRCCTFGMQHYPVLHDTLKLRLATITNSVLNRTQATTTERTELAKRILNLAFKLIISPKPDPTLTKQLEQLNATLPFDPASDNELPRLIDVSTLSNIIKAHFFAKCTKAAINIWLSYGLFKFISNELDYAMRHSNGLTVLENCLASSEQFAVSTRQITTFVMPIVARRLAVINYAKASDSDKQLLLEQVLHELVGNCDFSLYKWSTQVMKEQVHADIKQHYREQLCNNTTTPSSPK